jgi:hypothetical protein
MIYENLIQENKIAFLAKLTEISGKLRVVPDWLMVVFKIESNINHRAINPYTQATGLIQFMPATAAGLGTSIGALRTMSNVQQLDYVYKYFAPYAGRIGSIQDLYTITFFPRALGKPDNYVLQTDTIGAGTIAAQNKPYDLNNDSQITYGELKQAISRKIPADAAEALKKKLFGLV